MFKNKLMGLFLFFVMGISTLGSNTYINNNNNSINTSNNNEEVNTNTLIDNSDYDAAAVWGKTHYSDSLEEGSGTLANPYKINTEMDWGYLLHFYNKDCTVTTTDPKTYYELTADLDLTSLSAIMWYMPTNMVLLGDGYTVKYNGIIRTNVDGGTTCGIINQAYNVTLDNINFEVNYFYLTEDTPVAGSEIIYGSLCAQSFSSTFHNVKVNLKNPDSVAMKLITENDTETGDDIRFGNLFGTIVNTNVLHCFYTGNSTFTFTLGSLQSECIMGSLAGCADGDIVVIDTEVESCIVILNANQDNNEISVTNSAIIGYVDSMVQYDCTLNVINSKFEGDELDCEGNYYDDVHATINTYYIGNIDDASVKLSYVSLYNLNEWSVSNIYTYDAVALKFDDLPSTSIEYVCLGFGSQLEYSIAGDANYKYNYLTTDNRFINTVTVGEYEFYTVEQLLNYNSCYQLAKSYGTYFKDSYSSIDYSLVKLAGINAFSDGVYDFTELDTISYSTFFETGTGEDIINQAYDIGTSDNNLIDLPSNITVGGFSYDVYWFVVDVDSDTSDVLYNAESNYYFNTIFIARLDDGSGDEDEQPIFVYPDTTYNIIYEVNGGIMNDVEYPTTYKTGDKVVLPMGVSKEGYIFVGWYLDSRLTKKMIQSISTLAQGTITVYAKYISKDSLSDGEFYVNIEVPGHSEDIITGNYKTGDVIDLPTFTQEGYTLIGYRDNPYNEGELVSKVTVGTSNLFHTYYPVWAKEVTK